MERPCKIFFLTFILSISAQESFVSSELIASAPVGNIQGTELEDINGQKYAAFRGIPFAKPPVGELRFAKPEPLPKFEETFDATKEAKQCPQPEPVLFGKEQGSEDCLTLNIYMHKFEPNTNLKKVIVFIHGGAFFFGSANPYNAGTFVTSHDVITVTINYRVGVLGFLSTETKASPGNYGLWDQALALKWVKGNIRAFGGDPNDVAISGESAGSISVSLLSISPVTKGLFTKAFMQSGGATAIFAISRTARHDSLVFAKSVNCWDGETDVDLDFTQSEVLMKCLRQVPESEFPKFFDFSGSSARFTPRVDGDLIPKTPMALLQDDAYLESVGFFNRTYLVGIDNSEVTVTDRHIVITEMMIFNNNETSEEEKVKTFSTIRDAIVETYTSSRLGVKRAPEDVQRGVKDWYQRRCPTRYVAQLASDMTFTVPAYDFMNAAVRKESTKVWLVYFNAFPAYMKGSYRGIAHGADLLYWFDLTLKNVEMLLQVGIEGEMDEEDLEMKKMFSSIIAEFTKKGDPSAAVKNKLPFGWPTYDVQGSQYLNFNLNPSVRQHLERDGRDFWLREFPALAARHRRHDEL